MSKGSRGVPVVSFSGIDGCGKSTQLDRVGALLEQSGRRPVTLWSRGGYTSGMQAAKRLARRLGGKRLPAPGQSEQRTRAFRRPIVTRLWLTAALLDLIRVYGIQVRWWRLSGRSVLCDRYLWDTFVDFKMTFPDVELERLWLWRLLCTVAAQPDYAFYFQLSPEAAEERSIQKGDPWPEPLADRRRRETLYEELIRQDRFVVLDAAQSADGIFEQLAQIISHDGDLH